MKITKQYKFDKHSSLNDDYDDVYNKDNSQFKGVMRANLLVQMDSVYHCRLDVTMSMTVLTEAMRKIVVDTKLLFKMHLMKNIDKFTTFS